VTRAVQIKNGNVIEWRDGLWKVVSSHQTFVGKRGAYMQMKLQSIDDGHIETHRFRSSDEVERAFVETRRMEYLYEDGVSYVFMEPKTGQQVHLGKAFLSEALPYLAYNTQVEVQFHGDRPVAVAMPPSVALEVIRTEPAVRGDTATAVTKPAQVETGLTVRVPGHITTGERIRVDTRSGQFLGRE